MHIEKVPSSVDEAISSLPEKVAEEIWQQTIRILQASSKPKDNLSRAERGALQGS
jgi:hypothetical protein